MRSSYLHSCYKRPRLFCVECSKGGRWLSLDHVRYFIAHNRNITPDEAYEGLVVRFPLMTDYEIKTMIRQVWPA
jgi:hypothetical protein